MIKKQKTLILLLVILIVAMTFPALTQENMQTYKTKSFTYILPNYWIKIENEDEEIASYYYGRDVFVVNELDCFGRITDSTNKKETDALFQELYSIFISGNNPSKEKPIDFFVGSCPAKIYNLYSINTHGESRTAFILIYANDRVFVAFLACPDKDFKEINDLATEFALNVTFKGDPAKQSISANNPTPEQSKSAEISILSKDYLVIPTYDVYLNSFKNYLPAEYHDIHKTLYDFGGLENGGFLYGVSYEKGLLGSNFRYSIYGDKGNNFIKEIEIKVSDKEYSENKYMFIICLRSSIMGMLPEYYDNPSILDTILKNIAFDEITNTSFNTAKQSYIYGAYEYTFEKNDGYKFTMLSVFD